MIPAIMLLGVIYLFDSGKLELAGLLYGVAIITKPQSLMIGLLLAAASSLRSTIRAGGMPFVHWRR